MSRSLEVSLQVLVSGAIFALLLWQIDLGQTLDILRDSRWAYVAASLAIFLATTWLMAWRWWVLLAARDVHEPYHGLVRMYFVSYAASQVMPTAVGGDTVRIIEHARRRPEVRATAAGAVVMERILGLFGTLVLLAAMIVLGLLIFSRRIGRHLEERLFPLGRRVKLEGPLQSLYRTMHEYRNSPGVLSAVFLLTPLPPIPRGT